MAKLTRILQKIFSYEAPLAQVAQFGSLAENASLKTKDPAVIQALANWESGWYSAVRGAYSPTVQDMNGVLLVLSYQLAYLLQQGIAEWSSETVYYANSMVMVDGIQYISLQNDNENHAVTDAAWWSPYERNIRTISLSNETLLSSDDTVLFNPPAGLGFQFTLPPASECKGKKLYIKNVGLGILGGYGNDYGVEKIDGADEVDLSEPMSSIVLICDGSNWFKF
jgi:hypothetical protein